MGLFPHHLFCLHLAGRSPKLGSVYQLLISLSMLLCTSGGNYAIACTDALKHYKVTLIDQRGPQIFLIVIIQDLIQFIYHHIIILSHIWPLFLAFSFLIIFFQALSTSQSLSEWCLTLHNFVYPGDIWRSLDTISWSSLGTQLWYLHLVRVETTCAAKHHKMHRKDPTDRNCVAQSVNGAIDEKHQYLSQHSADNHHLNFTKRREPIAPSTFTLTYLDILLSAWFSVYKQVSPLQITVAQVFLFQLLISPIISGS